MQKKEHEQPDDRAKPRIVEATGSAPGSANPNIKARAVEAAMAESVRQSARDGVTDPAEIKRRMLEARERLKTGQ